MNALWQRLTVPINDDDVLDHLRLRFVAILAVTFLILILIGFVVRLLTGNIVNTLFIIGIPLTVTCFTVLWLVSQRYLLPAATLLLIAITMITMAIPGLALPLLGAITLVCAASLAPWPAYIVVNVLVYLRVGLFILDEWQRVPAAISPENASSQDLFRWIIILFVLIVVSFTVRFFIDAAQRSVDNARRNARLLRGVAEVGQILSSLHDAQQIFERSITLIQDRFGFYHVQVFIIEENGEYANLAASTGEPGKQLLARRHRLNVGANSVVGKATGDGVAIMALDTKTDKVHSFNDLLPNTRSELAIPIIENDQVIGALDVQSTQRRAFKSEDIQALQTMASLLGTAVTNAHLFEEQRRGVLEQQRLFLESESNLREIRRLNQQLTKEGWMEYVSQVRSILGVTLEGNRVLNDLKWTDTLAQAAYLRRSVSLSNNGKTGTVAVPLILRGEVIGAIEVQPGDDIQQNDAVEMMEAVAERLSISLENARLFEESQAATIQEQQINDIVSRYQEVTNVDDLLRITLEELSESLGARQGSIRLGVTQPDEQEEVTL